ncbi:hypothetical protein CRG98_021295 [Punica granatum]|uniref:Uncharacterized protein n=1 Tax=Punica granatum TaxID=22663 RepID=A0A2I0JPU1_PUNGR|nr:hypothetical protein CRG98_021295 [Punica granatum]
MDGCLGTCDRDFPRCSLNVSGRSGIVVKRSEIIEISVFHGHSPEARRETFMTTKMSLGKPSRALEGHLKLVPRPWWSLGACRPVWGAVCLSVERVPEALSEKASVRDRGVPA